VPYSRKHISDKNVSNWKEFKCLEYDAKISSKIMKKACLDARN